MEWENKLVNGFIHRTRFIASWMITGRNPRKDPLFRKWINSLDIPEEDKDAIIFLCDNGKLELETSAARFIKAMEAEPERRVRSLE